MQEPKEPPDREKVADAQKAFAEAVSRTTRFLVSTAIILSLLIIIVGQELREYRKKQLALAESIDKNAVILRAINRRLNEIYTEISKELPKDVHEEVGFAPRDIPKHTGRVIDSNDIETLVSDEKKLDTLIEQTRTKLNDKKKGLDKDANKQQRPAVNKVAPAQGYIGNEKTRPLPAPLATTFRDKIDEDEQQPDEADPATQKFTTIISLMGKYREQYHDRATSAQRLIDRTTESKALNSATKSIPTPFGSFQVAPKLALLALSFATLICYFSFHFSIRRIWNIAHAYKQACRGQEVISSRIDTPFWLYGKASDETQILAWSPKAVLLSFVVHILWLFTAGWLVAESLLRWNATKSLAFSYKIFWAYLLVACYVVAVLLAAWLFAPARVKKFITDLWASERVTNLTRRRAVLGLGALAVVGMAAGGIIIFLRRGAKKSQRLYSLRVSELNAVPTDYSWVMNKRTNVVHYEASCRKHLPSKKYRAEVSGSHGNLLIHSDYTPRVMGQLAEEAFNNEKYDQAIILLKQAITLSPFSYHYYDKLVKIFGRLKRYEEIRPLLEGGVNRVKSKIDDANGLKNKAKKVQHLKRFRQIQQGFELRLNQVEDRKRIAEEYRQDKEKEQAEKKNKK